MAIARQIALIAIWLILGGVLFTARPGHAAGAAEPVNLAMMTAIREEGLKHSRLMNNLSYLTEVIGPRLTGSPQMRQAAAWAIDTFKSWGIKAHGEPFEFGRGWTMSRVAVSMISPQAMPLMALPKAWSPGTNGPIRGEAVKAVITSEADFARYHGKLRGKIVFLGDVRKMMTPKGPVMSRYSAEDLEKLRTYEMPDQKEPDWKPAYLKALKFRKPLLDFLAREGAIATVEESDADSGIIRVMGYTYRPSDTPKFPRLVMAAENYNHVVRLLDRGFPVTLAIDVGARFVEGGGTVYNVIAEIPGSSKADEIVMAGAHYDSWHGGTGASDDGAGVAVVMEAMRILKTLGVKPKRTIRVALWAGEEQGLLGSAAYVAAHFASRPEPAAPWQKRLPPDLRDPTWPIERRPAYGKFSVYFNVDNGSGKIRGIYAEDNVAAKAIFDAWLIPFHDLGAGTGTLRETGSTDHVAFDSVGLPGFEFIQDPLDYMARLHHTNLDTLDHIQPDDLKQAAVIVAAFLYDAAMSDHPMPRKPMPHAPGEAR